MFSPIRDVDRITNGTESQHATNECFKSAIVKLQSNMREHINNENQLLRQELSQSAERITNMLSDLSAGYKISIPSPCSPRDIVTINNNSANNSSENTTSVTFNEIKCLSPKRVICKAKTSLLQATLNYQLLGTFAICCFFGTKETHQED